ncbi:hypothetical protein Moror_12617 [Moniliophthora roreri MCA 2997]|uniref:DUF202 domain-containing protein n=2 Tax=Moniliophthora roreri TaxID=221103 RepID=V2XSU1_MONRO|nr:hypothetical protein Moror_12617 [Moniliophthora roreri MCA 2997]KAI3621156.1 hypothetical protein WG66_014356 [Moniliophthora roreri]
MDRNSQFGTPDSKSTSNHSSYVSTSPLNLNTNFSDSDDNLPTPKGTSPPPNESIPGPSTSKRSLRFSAFSSSRPNMSHLLEKQSPAPAEVHRSNGDLMESPVEERSRSQTQREEGQDTASRDSTQGGAAGDSPQNKRPWQLGFQPVLVLENSGSVARDHLASERTFLAYVRTSLAIASTGVALVQLFTISLNANSSTLQLSPISERVQSWARPLGVTTVCLGIAVLLIGVTRYFTVQQALTKGKFPVARFLVGSIAFVLALVVIIVFGVLVAGGGPRRT